MVWSTNADDAKMLLDIPLPMNNVIIDQSALNLYDSCLDTTLQILRKSLLCFAKFGRLTVQKLPKFAIGL